MNGQQSIVEKIVSDAKQRAEDILKKAQTEAQEILESANSQHDQLNNDLIEQSKEQAKNIIATKLSQVNLEIRRKSLMVKFNALEQAFDIAKNKILSLSDQEYLSYIKKQIATYAQDNDEVVISKRDEKRITSDFILELSKSIGKKLTLSKTFGNFEGGVVLKSKYFDSNLTIDSNFKVFKSQFEAQASKMLGE